MKISINPNPDKPATPFTAHIDTSKLTIHKPSIFNSPIHLSSSNGQKNYHVDICGFRIIAPQIEMLAPQIETLLDGLINLARLPRHVFVARRAGRVYPVYTIGHEVLVTTPGGPMFKHVELAKVRDYLTDYLHDTAVLGKNGVSEKLHVRGVNMHTLELRRPVMYLKKRVTSRNQNNENDFWAPVFENGNSDGIYTYAASARRDVPFRSSGTETLLLTQIVAEALRTDKRLTDIYDLRPDRLMPSYWARLKQHAQYQGQIELGGKEVDLYTSHQTWLGVEERVNEERYGLYIESSREGVVKQIATDFQRRGLHG